LFVANRKRKGRTVAKVAVFVADAFQDSEHFLPKIEIEKLGVGKPVASGMPQLHALGPGGKSWTLSSRFGHAWARCTKNSGGGILGFSCSHVMARFGAANGGGVIESPPDLNSDTIQNPIGLLTDDFSILDSDNASPTDAALFRPS
jgi:hypothetical protein